MDNETKTILVVDDERVLLETLCSFLSVLGYRAVGESNALCAVDAIERENPDLVTLDMIMPGATGLDVLKAMRAKGIQTPVIIISGFMNNISLQTLTALGVRCTITKPFSIHELEEKIHSILGTSE